MLRRNLARILLAAVLPAGLAVAGLAFAASVELEEPTLSAAPAGTRPIPDTVWFQGFLADADAGDPITDTFDIVARIYDQTVGGSLEWGPESHNGTTITDGWFNIELGSSMSLPTFDDPPYYLQLAIDGEIMEPRLKIASVPTALRSGTVDQLLPYAGDVSVSSPAFLVSQDGTGYGGRFERGGPGDAAAVLGFSTGSGPGVEARNTDSGPALMAESTGDDWAGLFLGDIQVDGAVNATATDTFAARFSSEAPGAIVIESRYRGPNDAVQALGIYSEAYVADGWGFGGIFDGSFMGAYGHVNPMPSVGGGFGVVGECIGGDGLTSNTGVYGYADGGVDNYGVVGDAIGGGPRQETWAGYFYGDVYADQYWSPVARMKIDHPVTPGEATLSHAYVASDDMKTVYDGTVMLDGSGAAWVELPNWFEALNGSFRYQLTPIGAAAPNLHIASPIAGNRFAIGGGEPGLTVCWQVTGIRHDAVAEMRREPVESAKLGDKRGRYMNPEAFGLPESMATDWSEERERGRALLRERFGREE